MIDTTKRLNAAFESWFGEDLEAFVPLLYAQNSNNISFLDPNKSVFLQPMVTNAFTYVVPGQSDNRGVVYRGVVPYAEAQTMLTSPSVFTFYMSLFLNQGLGEVTRWIGPLTGRQPKFTSFIHSPDHAGYEFRIFVDKINN